MDREQVEPDLERLASGPWIARGESESDFKARVERDLEQFAALAPTLGHQAVIETADAVLPVQMRRFVDEIRRDFGPDVQIRWIRAIDVVRRYRIRRAARARKAGRGWR